MAMLCGQVANAAELTVTNVAKVGADTVQFDITWPDSWRASWNEADTKLTNWDAAWIFVKVRRKGDAAWGHATLSAKDADHLAPKGARIDVGMTGKKAMGVFLYRSDDGKGTFVNKGVKLKCLDKIDKVELFVHAIEMVYVPQGAFYVGSAGKLGGSFTDGAWKKGDAVTPFKISSEAELKIASEAGCLYGTGGVGAAHQIGPAGKLSAEFPKGYGAIYCMKYETSQGHYAAFLNQLSPAQASKRFPTFPAKHSSTGHTIKKTSAGYVASKPRSACNWVSWDDTAAYIDWAGLRPMSELEYEKACRGPLKPVTDEYAWGSAELPCPHEKCKDTQVICAKLDWPWILDPTVTPPVPMPQAICGAEGRVKSGATYWGIAAMSGHLRERAVTVGHKDGRVFTGRCGDGAVTDDALANVAGWPGLMATWEKGQRYPTTGVGFRGGPWYTDKARLRVSDRYMSSVMRTGRDVSYGFRAVRQAPVNAAGGVL
jgi:formylglycine-generating enzyme required for sulfatase activity